MENSFDLQTLLMVAGGVLILLAVVLLLKQLFKLVVIVLAVLALLVVGYKVADANHLFDDSAELKAIGKAMDRAGELGGEAVRKGKSIKEAIDTLTSPFSSQESTEKR